MKISQAFNLTRMKRVQGTFHKTNAVFLLIPHTHLDWFFWVVAVYNLGVFVEHIYNPLVSKQA